MPRPRKRVETVSHATDKGRTLTRPRRADSGIWEARITPPDEQKKIVFTHETDIVRARFAVVDVNARVLGRIEAPSRK
jgi:hypothetical protein